MDTELIPIVSIRSLTDTVDISGELDNVQESISLDKGKQQTEGIYFQCTYDERRTFLLYKHEETTEDVTLPQ